MTCLSAIEPESTSSGASAAGGGNLLSDRFGADSTSCIAEEGSIYPTSLSAMEDDFDAGADERTALQKLMYPDQEELPDNFEVTGVLCRRRAACPSYLHMIPPMHASMRYQADRHAGRP